jgi:5,10-methenyltetrahydrofolate synthetase
MSAAVTLETTPESPSGRRSGYRATLRRQLVERRLALPAEQCAALSATICEILRTHFAELATLRVAFCWPVKNEPDLRPLMTAWQAAGQPGFAALLPVVIAPGAPLAFRTWTPDSEMMTDRYGIPTPATGEFVLPQALLLPVNGFDNAGYRIGYGGGFFDRTLAALKPMPQTIGVGFELARVDSIRPEPHDIRLDAIVSEAGVFRFGEVDKTN